MIYGQGPRPDRIFTLKKVEDDPRRLEKLEYLVKRLEDAIEEKFARIVSGDSPMATFAALQLAGTVLDFQHKHWWSEKKKEKISPQHESALQAALKPVDSAMKRLEDAAWQDFEQNYLAPEHERADELLDLLDAKKGDDALHALIAVAFTDRTGISTKLRSKTIDLTLRACSALARSGRTERFVREHVIDLLEEGGRDLTPVVEHVLLTDGAELGKHCVEGWEGALAQLRAGAGDPSVGSTLRPMQHGIRAYRLGLSGVSALLEQGVVAQILVFLQRGAYPGASGLRTLAWNLAAHTLRSLAADAVQHRAQKGQLLVAGIPQLRNIIHTLREIDDASAKFVATSGGSKPSRAFWLDQGKRLKDLQVRPVPRSLPGASLRVGVSMLALGLAMQDLEWDDPASMLTLLSASVSLSEHALRATELVVQGPPIGGDIAGFDRWVKGLSSAASFVAGAASMLRVHDALAKGQTVQAALEAVNGASCVGVGIGQWLMARGTYAAAGAVLNAWAVAIGIAALLARLAYDALTNVGTRPILEAILKRIEELPDSHGIRRELRMVLEEIADASHAFVSLRRIPGSAADPQRGGSPTYWQAAKAGFSKSAIETLFDAGRVEVAVHLSPLFDRELSQEGGTPE